MTIYITIHPPELVLMTFLGLDPCSTDSTISVTSSKSGNEFVLSFEWISWSLIATSKEAVKPQNIF